MFLNLFKSQTISSPAKIFADLKSIVKKNNPLVVKVFTLTSLAVNFVPELVYKFVKIWINGSQRAMNPVINYPSQTHRETHNQKSLLPRPIRVT